MGVDKETNADERQIEEAKVKKKTIKKVIKEVEKKVEKKKTLEELDREIKWIKTEWRSDYGSARSYIRRNLRENPGTIHKILKIPEKGFCILVYGRKTKDYENPIMGKEVFV